MLNDNLLTNCPAVFAVDKQGINPIGKVVGIPLKNTMVV
jgi:hypothetical protein